jgi:acyl carrier protein
VDRLASTPGDARRALLLAHIRDRVRQVLGFTRDATVDGDRPLGELGLDSLLSVELRNLLGQDLERRLPATLLFDHPTPAALVDHFMALLAPEQVPAANGAAPHDAVGLVETLSDDEVDRLLAEKLYRHE